VCYTGNQYLKLMDSSVNFKSVFGQIQDHRSYTNKLHNLEDMLLIGIIAVISGAETWDQMFGFAQSKEVFLKKFIAIRKFLQNFKYLLSLSIIRL
jgi:hypothetical protein